MKPFPDPPADAIPAFLVISPEKRKEAWTAYDSKRTEEKSAGDHADPVPVKPIEDEVLREADRRWRSWMPSARERKRPRLSTFVKAIRRERKAEAKLKRQQEKQAMKTSAAGSKADQVATLRKKRAVNGPKKLGDANPISQDVADYLVDQVTNAIGHAPINSPKPQKPTADAAAQPKESSVKTQTQKATKATTTKAKPTKRTRSEASANLKKAKANARKPVDNGPAEPRGMAIEIGKLAARANGASREELIKLTGWKQQAWKWYFVNSKDNGFCQKFGYKLDVIEGKDGESRYKISKK